VRDDESNLIPFSTKCRGIRKRLRLASWALFIFGSLLPTASQAAISYYVSPNGNDGNPGTESAPFGTIERAREVVRTVNSSMSGDIIVFLRGGTYELADTVVFDKQDSGTNGWNVVYTAYPGEKPAISGGQRINRWTAVGNGVYKANVGSLRFRQLYVNGTRAIRARTPNAHDFYKLIRWDETGRTFAINGNEIANWTDLNHVEMIILKEWTQNNLRIGSFSVSGGEAYVSPIEPDRTKAFKNQVYLRKDNQSYFFENAFEFLDAEGEWYLNSATNELFYKARAGEDMSSAIVIVPRLERLVQIQGTLDKPVRNIQFLGLLFEYSTWMLPSSEGFANAQADVLLGGTSGSARRIPAGIHIQNASGLRFERNVIRHMGGTAVNLYSGTRDNQLIGNLLRDISASGIAVDLELQKDTPDPRMICKRDVIANNYITQTGRDYYSSVGIFAGYTEGIKIEHNELTDITYTGISLGWGWTDTDTTLRNNTVRFNRIHQVMNQMADGGGIYTLSKQPGTVLEENYVYDIIRSPWAGGSNISAIYLDEGSNLITVKNNVFENVAKGIFFHRASWNTVINNTATLEERNNSHDNSFTDESGLIPALIKLNAGLETVYQDVPNLDSGDSSLP